MTLTEALLIQLLKPGLFYIDRFPLLMGESVKRLCAEEVALERQKELQMQKTSGG